jgi:hypothetical protein
VFDWKVQLRTRYARLEVGLGSNLKAFLELVTKLSLVRKVEFCHNFLAGVAFSQQISRQPASK